MLGSSASSITMRSMPGADPPCGGAPNLSADSMPPKRDSTTSGPYPAISNALYMMAGSWLRMAPEESSTPLQTMSYWNALISSGSMLSSASSPPCGMEKGLWLKPTLPVAASRSYIGKSTIQQKRNAPFSSRSRSSPSFVRAAPARSAALSGLSAAKNTASPGPAPVAARSASTRGSSRKREIGPRAPFSSSVT